MTPFVLPSILPLMTQIKASSGKLLALAFFGTVLHQGMGYFAAAMTTATNMGIITSLIPVATLGISSILLL